jgi:predicted phosphate transport protein (TIGR00153 family)
MMFARLMPREEGFFDFFEQHADVLVRGTATFAKLFEPGADIAGVTARVRELEHEADSITHRCVEALHKTFITPIDRDDIHRLITRLDDVMDFVDAASERIALYELTEMNPDAKDLADVLVRAARDTQVACKGLRNLKDSRTILAKCVEINRLENEADEILRRGVAKLFKEHKDDPIYVIKWKEILDNLEIATDRCEDVANTIEGVVLEHG